MAKAFVSEGTRRMAHNLDDLYERWRYKKMAEAEYLNAICDTKSLRKYHAPSSDVEARQWWRDLVNETQELELQLGILGDSPIRDRAKAELTYKRAAQRYLKDEARRLWHEDEVKAVLGDGNAKYEAIMGAYDLLKSLNKTGKVEYSDDEWAAIDRLRAVAQEYEVEQFGKRVT